MTKAPVALLCTAAVAMLLPALTTATPEIGAKHNGLSICDEQALRLYARAHERFGADAVGRNRVDDGKLLESGRVVPEPHPCAWRDKLEAMLNPPEPVAASIPESVAPAPAPVSVAPASTGGGCVGMEAESGSAGYAAYNPSSGAAGCYQIIPSTAAAHGCDLSTPGGQDACAQAICATEGSAAWASSGANPC